MTPEEVDKALARFRALWPTPKMTDDQAMLWHDRIKAIDVATGKLVLDQLERTCKRRPALAEFHEAVAMIVTSASGTAIATKSSYWAKASRPTNGHHEVLLSAPVHDVSNLRDWITLQRGWIGEDGEIVVMRRDITGPHSYADHRMDEGDTPDVRIVREWFEEIAGTMRLANKLSPRTRVPATGQPAKELFGTTSQYDEEPF